MIHDLPEFPFDGLAHEEQDYVNMMDFIIKVESVQAKFLGDWMASQFPAMKKVVDLGCGPGLYLTPYKKAGMQVMGIDGCSEAGLSIAKREFARKDLRFALGPDELVWKEKADLAICFEVAEHLHERFADTLVNSICACGRMVLFTGAVPGQGGTFHYNEQPHAYWLRKFWDRGYGVHPMNTAMHQKLEELRPQESTGEVSGWLLNNTYLLAEHRLITSWEKP